MVVRRPDCNRSSATTPSARGVTLMELLVVLAVMLILTSAIVSGYTNMRRAQRINKSTESLISTLNLARNLAISNNAVAYVEVVGINPANPVNNGAKQMLKIHLFPNSADALTVAGEPAANTTIPNPISNTPANLVVLAPNAWNPTAKFPWTEPLSIPYQDASPSTPIPGYGQSYNNYVAESMLVEPGTLIGIYPMIAPADPVTGTSPVLIGFNADGTCCTPAAKLYVTDDAPRFYNKDTTVLTGMQGHDPHLKSIAVYGGGMIKLE